MSVKWIALFWCACVEPSHDAIIGNVGNSDGPALARWHDSFPLTNGHGHARCDDCHRPARRLDPNCTANGICHDGDPHHGLNGSSCVACHVSGTWAVAR